METKITYPKGTGAMLRGWHAGYNSILDFRAMTERCPHDCFFCFTDKRKRTLTLQEILRIIDEAADYGFKAIDYLGEGEPTLDKDFFQIVEHTSKKGLVPVVFTDAATKLRDEEFVKRLYDSGASVCPKCDSLFNEDYQNWVVGDKKGLFFKQRNEAIELLIEQGFNKDFDGMTRLGFDMVVSKRNVQEIEKTLEHCRNNNIWIVFSTYLPAGRSGRQDFDKALVLSGEELSKMRGTIRNVDLKYEFDHPIWNNFGTMPCSEFMCVYGDGRVTPCVGNEAVIGNIKTESIPSLAQRILKDFPCHNPTKLDGYCIYRQR
jgi:MoaA/NifB/PqqE/SkfB family radical SAM enzyme